MSYARDLSSLPACSRSPEGRRAMLVEPPAGHRYKLLHKLGEGDSGELWCAEQVGLRRRVALKFLKQHLEEDAVACQRFLREARVAASASHPGVVEVFDIVDQDGTRPVLVMQMLAGRPLAEAVRPGAALAPRRALRLLRTLAEALAHLHSKGISHCDVRPETIMLLEERGDFGRPETCKFTEFGLAEHSEEGPDPRADICALGWVAYFMLTGVRSQRARGQAPALPRLRVSVRMQQKLQAVLDQACHKEPARRFDSADALARAFADAARGEVSRRESGTGRAKAWASVAVGLAACLGVAGQRASLAPAAHASAVPVMSSSRGPQAAAPLPPESSFSVARAEFSALLGAARFSYPQATTSTS